MQLNTLLIKVQNLELPKLFYVKCIYNVMKVNHVT